MPRVQDEGLERLDLQTAEFRGQKPGDIVGPFQNGALPHPRSLGGSPELKRGRQPLSLISTEPADLAEHIPPQPRQHPETVLL